MVSTRGNANHPEDTEASAAAANRGGFRFNNSGAPPPTVQHLCEQMLAMQDRLTRTEQELTNVRAERDTLLENRPANSGSRRNRGDGENSVTRSQTLNSRTTSDARTGGNGNGGGAGNAGGNGGGAGNAGGNGGNDGENGRRFYVKDFWACATTKFFGDSTSVEDHRWLREVERAFAITDCPEGKKVMLATQLFRKNAADWWETQTETLGTEVVDHMSWEAFTEMFKKEYFTVRERQVMEREFLSMTKGDKSMKEHVRLFAEKLRFCTRLCPDEVSKVGRFVESLPVEYKSLVRLQTTLKAAYDTALSMEEDFKPRMKKDDNTGFKRKNDGSCSSSKRFKGNSSKGWDDKKDKPWCS